MSEQIESSETNQVIRLPLWKSALEDMRKEGVSYGKTYPSEYFEKQLKVTRDTMQFGLAISEIRRELEMDGFYLSGRGQNGNQFVILAPENNQDVMQSYQRAALDALKRGVILGTNTRLDLLQSEDRRRHEALLEKLAIRTLLFKKTREVVKVLRENRPKILSA